MKKFLGVLAVMVAIVSALAGCSANAAYSAEERQVIDTANKLICNECDVTFDTDDFYYSSGIHAKWKEVLMASTEEYLAYALDLLCEAPAVTHRKMMGEYLLYSEGFIIGGIYDDRLLLKDVPAARKSFPSEDTPYEGAKPMLLVDSDDPTLIAATVAAMLPQLPPPKKNRKSPLDSPLR